MSKKMTLPVSVGEEGGAVKDGECGLGGMSGRRVESPVMEECPGGGAVYS